MPDSPILRQRPLSSQEPQKWFAETVALLPSALRRHKSQVGDLGPRTRVHYCDFLEVIQKYADTHKLMLHLEEDQNNNGEYFLYLTGETADQRVLPNRKKKRFQLSLNQACKDGVFAEEIANFRHAFFITDNDAKFYQRHVQVPL